MADQQEFTHLLLTRFNTAIGYAPGSRGLDENWLLPRLALFEQYCLPSVAAQSGVTFHWLVFCDAASPQWFRTRMDSYGPLLRPVYIEGPATDEVIAQSIVKTGIVTTPYLITTRLDNDDAIGNEHLALVQYAFERQEREFIEFPIGLQSYRGQLYRVNWPSNPFLSLIEKVQTPNTFTTILCVPHDKVHSAGVVRSLKAAPQWLQVIHSSNLLNSLRGWPRLSNNPPANFTVNWPADVQSESLARRVEFAAAAFFGRGKKAVNRLVSRPRSA